MTALEASRIIAGGLFFVWFAAVLRAGYQALRPWHPPESWKSKYGEVDPHSDEFRRLILK